MPQLFVCEKSLALAPAMAMLVNLTLLALVLVTVSTFAALTVPTDCSPKERTVGATPRTVPVAVNAVAWGLAGSESLTATAAFRAPLAVGWNVTVAVQVAPGLNSAPHLLVTLKSAGSRPDLLEVQYRCAMIGYFYLLAGAHSAN